MRWRSSLLWGTLLLAGGAAALWALVFKPVPVFVHEVHRGEVQEQFPGTGSIEFERVSALGFEVSGRIVAIHAGQGDRVKAGQVLASLDHEVVRAEEAAAAEDVELVRASLDRLQADVARAIAQRDGAEAHAKRQEDAFRSHSVSQDALDQAVERLRVTEADVARAKAALNEGQRKVAFAVKQLEAARARLARAKLVSPVDGLVLARLAEPGDVAVTGGVILRVGETSAVWASVWVDEIFLSRLQRGQPARVFLRSAPGQSLEASVLRVGLEVDRESRELVVDLLIAQAPPTLAAGQRADALIMGDRAPDALFVPAVYLLLRGGASWVWVDEGGRAALREVRTGLQSRERVEIRQGLREGERVIRPAPGSAASLSEGARISVQEALP